MSSETFHVVKTAPAVHIGSTFGGLLSQPALERNYLKLLTTSYAPDTLADWQKALGEEGVSFTILSAHYTPRGAQA